MAVIPLTRGKCRKFRGMTPVRSTNFPREFAGMEWLSSSTRDRVTLCLPTQKFSLRNLFHPPGTETWVGGNGRVFLCAKEKNKKTHNEHAVYFCYRKISW